MVNFAGQRVKLAAIAVSKVLMGAISLSMVGSLLPARAVSFVVSDQVQQNTGQLRCSSSEITALVNRLSQPGSSSAFDSLVQCGEPAVPVLTAVLNDRSQDPLPRRVVARALGQIGAPEAIAALLSVAQQRQSPMRDSALRAITDINPQARAAVPVLLKAVISRDIDVVNAGTQALRMIDPAVPVQVITSFQEATVGGNAHRYRVTNRLLDQFWAARSNLADLTQTLQDPDPVVRAIAAYFLIQVGHKAQTAIPQLTTALTDRDSLVRDTAACALGRIGTREAVTVLITQLKTGNEATQASAAIGLSSLTGEAKAAVPVLIAALRDDNEQVRSMAAYALGQIGKGARRAIPALLGRLSDPSASIRATAAYGLGQIAPDDPRVIRLLVRQVAADVDPIVRDSTTESLRQMTPEATSTLLEIFANQNPAEAEAAARLLLNFDSMVGPYLTSEQLPMLLQGISRVSWVSLPDSRRTEFANYTLQQFGSAIVPTLIASLNSPNPDIRVGATWALLIGYSERYFDRQLIEPAIPTLTQTFRNSRLYTLWKRENQALVMAAYQYNQAAYSQVQEIVFSDRVGLSALELLVWLDGSFMDELKRENVVAANLVEHLVFSRIVAAGGELVLAVAVQKERPAICRVAFMQRFLWRCR